MASTGGPSGRRGLAVRIAYLLIAGCAAAWSRLGGRWSRSRTVLAYHGVRAAQAGRFARQMDWLARSPVRQRVELTFDDGYANLLSHAAPPIDRHGLNATAFIVTGCAGERPRWLASDPMHPEAGERLLDREGARGLADRPNWTVGAHTHHHVDLIRCEPDRAAEELAMSRHWLGMAIGRPVDLVAFPYGRYSGDVLRWADKAGYRRAFGLSHRLAQKIPEDIELIERISMSPDAWMVEFKLAAWGGYDWLVPWRSWLGRLGRGRRRAEAASNVGAEPGAFAPTRSRFDQRTAA